MSEGTTAPPRPTEETATGPRSWLSEVLLVTVIVAGAAGVLLLMWMLRKVPEKKERPDRAQIVRVMEITPRGAHNNDTLLRH